MKTDAGWKLCTRKPSAAPAVIAASTPAASFCRSNAITANAAAEIAQTPAASPSMPSEKLTTFITPTSPSSVSTSPAVPNSTRPRNGSVTTSTLTPESTRMSAAATWPASFAPAPSSRQSSSAPTTVISAAPPRMPFVAWVIGRNSSAATSVGGEDRQAAEQRRRLAREPALLDRVDGADPPGEPRDGRRQERRHDERDEEAEQRVVLHCAREDRRAPGARRVCT